LRYIADAFEELYIKLDADKDISGLKGVLTKDYARSALDNQRFGEFMDLLGPITLRNGRNGKDKDLLGFLFESFERIGFAEFVNSVPLSAA
jgi:hypothetical protein